MASGGSADDAGGERSLRIAVAQWDVAFGDVAGNRATIERLLAGGPGFDLLVLPELCLTGYQFRDADEARALAEPVPGPSSRWLADLADARKAIVVAGFAEASGGRTYNAAVVAAPGGLLATYRKVHLFYREKDVFAPGDLGFPTWDLETACGPVRLGVMVCFDWIFPEAMRTLALAGADVVAHPSNLVLPHCPEAMITRCLENRVAAATSNRVGREDRWTSRPEPLTFIGRSQVVDPRGRRVASLGADEEGLVVATVDLSQARDKRVTGRNDLFADRRPETYDLGPGSRRPPTPPR